MPTMQDIADAARTLKQTALDFVRKQTIEAEDAKSALATATDIADALVTMLTLMSDNDALKHMEGVNALTNVDQLHAQLMDGYRNFKEMTLQPATQSMTLAEARKFRQDWDKEVTALDRMRKDALVMEYRRELAKHNRVIISGGPMLKEELIGSILELRYPPKRMAEAIHVSVHMTGNGTSSACEWCFPA